MNIKKQLEDIMPFVMVLLMIYYGGPLFMNSERNSIIIMLAVMPAAAVLCAFFCGIRIGFRPLYLVSAAAAFLPEYWVCVGDWGALAFYLLMYVIIAALGLALGWGVSRAVKRMLDRR